MMIQASMGGGFPLIDPVATGVIVAVVVVIAVIAIILGYTFWKKRK